MTTIKKVPPPALPQAPAEYERRYQDQNNNTLRLFFTRLVASIGELIDRIGDFVPGTAVWGSISGTLADQTDVQAAIDAAAGDAAWGGITGTLADQSDLQAELDLKAPIANPVFTGSLTSPGIDDNASSEVIELTSDDYLRMASGSLGIQFNGDTAAVNALDDYEEGSWTPTANTLSNCSDVVFTNGEYIKIGNQVTLFFEGTFTITTTTTTSRTGFLVQGAPYLTFGGWRAGGGGHAQQASGSLPASPLFVRDASVSSDDRFLLAVVAYWSGSAAFSGSITYKVA